MKFPHILFSLVSIFSRLIPSSVKQAVYRSPLLSRWVRSSLNRAAPDGLTPIEIAGGFLTGWRMALDLHKEKAYWLGTYEMDLQAAIRELVKPGMIAYDVGANIGYISLMLAKAVGETGKVYAFEALPANFERLWQHIRMNGLDNRILPFPFAIVDSVKPVDFWLGPSGAMGKAEGSAGRRDVVYTKNISVEGISLDSFVYDNNNPAPQVVKMDIEGGEVLALPGMQRILEIAHPIMLLELHGFEAAQVAWEILCGSGYRISKMAPLYPVVPTLEALDWKAYLVAVKS